MKNLLYKIVISLLLIQVLSCVSVRKQIDRGNYEEAIDKLVNKLSGKKNKPTESIQLLELAYEKAQQQDLRNEAQLLAEKEDNKWEKIYLIHQQIDKRQNKIRPLLPLISKEAYQGSFEFINTDERKRESKANSIEYYYSTAKELLMQSKTIKNKNLARDAYNYLNKLESLSTNYKDVRQLKLQALKLGTIYYYVTITNNTYKILPQTVEDNLLNISVSELNKNWKQYDMRRQSDITYDYRIVMNLLNLEFSPEREKSRIIEDVTESKEEKYILDKNGKIRNDSLGNPVKEIIVVKHENSIEETVQSKSVLLSGKLEWIDLATNNLERSEPIQVEFNFENAFGRLIKGDKKYLSKQSKELINRRETSFPTNEQMTVDAGERLKEVVKSIIYKTEKG